MVFTSDPNEIKRVYAADPAVLHAGASSAFLEPFAGPRSILVLDGAEHMRERKLMLPPFHGEALARWKATMASVAEEEIARWQPGRPLKTLEHMQHVALEVILRVVFGGGEPELRSAIRRALQVPMPMLLAMSLWQGERGPYAAYLRRVRKLDELLYERIDAADADGSLLAVLKAAEPEREQLRDQLATLLAAGHETTAGSLGWALERLARHPEILARVREGDEAYLDAVVKEVLRVRPVLAITPRKVDAAVRAGRLDAAARRPRHALHLPRAPAARRLGPPDRVPAGALPGRRARALLLHPVRRRRPALRRAPRSRRWR